MDNELKKKYGLPTAIALVIGIVIGSGVFFKAEKILTATGGNLPLGILDHCHRLMLGLGAIPVQEVADAVQAVGYDGPACLELFRPEYWRMPAEDVIRMGAETTRPFLG